MSYLATPSAITNHSTLADTSFTKQVVSTTVVALDDTQINYTPTIGATYVIYEVCGAYSYLPDASSSIACMRLEYSTDSGNTWTEFTGSQAYIGDGTDTDYTSTTFLIQFMVSAWTGARLIRLACRSAGTNTEFTFGLSWNNDNTEGVGSCPHVCIFSIK